MIEMSAECTIAIMENILEHDKKINIPTRNAMENAVRLLKETIKEETEGQNHEGERTAKT